MSNRKSGEQASDMSMADFFSATEARRDRWSRLDACAQALAAGRGDNDKLAAEMKLSDCTAALVIPSSWVLAAAGLGRIHSALFSPAWFIIGPSTVGLVEGAIPANGSCTLTAKVTAAVAGSFTNSLPAGALQTSNGNNAAPAVATLTVMGRL